MSKPSHGMVVTFYSYKGGTGRTMALANVAWILAANGKRVLAVDWDLESPGLHRYFSPFIIDEAMQTQVGVIQLIHGFQWSAASATTRTDDYTNVKRHAFTLDWPHFPDGGRLDFISAGRQNKDYATLLAGVNWDDFFQRQGGEAFVEAMRSSMQLDYDYALIDSRTGFSDVADICTLHLPDVVVDCFTLNEQGIDGAANAARSIQQHNDRRIRILPVPMRVDTAEKQKADAGRAAAQQRFAGLPAAATEADRERYWTRMHVPYRAFYGYEEVLATFGDPAGEPGSLLSAYELLTAEITDGVVTSLPPLDDSTRGHVVSQFQRHLVAAEKEVVLRYAPEDLAWAEWLAHVLTAADVGVVDATVGEAPSSSRSRELIIVSTASADGHGRLMPSSGEGRPALAVYVEDVPILRRVAPGNSVSLAGVAEVAAIGRVLRLVGRAGAEVNAAINRPRFPADGPGLHNLPARNNWFTGRDDDLRALRHRLRSGSRVVLSGARVALQGMGGIGKTQLALEYAHRFVSAYDVIWWIKADPVAFMDTQLDELGKRIEVHTTGPTPESANAVLHALGRGNPYRRWLVVFDNAEDPVKLQRWLPSGPGHVLITSRDPAWADQVPTIRVDVFKRRESIDHLHSRIEGIAFDNANRLAEVLGDLPIAVAASAAWLRETGDSVSDYMRRIEEVGPTAIALQPRTLGYPPDGDEATSMPVQAVWEMSLRRLQERSPAAYRLLQLCSVMDPSIDLELIYSDQLAQMLAPYNADVAEREVRGRLIKEVSSLALMRVEPRGERQAGERGAGRVSVHRLVQHVVRARMDERDLGEVRHQMHLVLARSRPGDEVDDPETWPRFRLLWPHLEVSGAVECHSPEVRRLIVDRVRYLCLVGDLNRGLDGANLADGIWVRHLGAMTGSTEAPADDAATLWRQLLQLRFNKANILRNLGRFDASLEIDQAVLDEQQQLLGADHPHPLMTAGSLAADLRGLGRYADALERDRATYANWLESYGGEHPRTLAALSNLAVSCRLLGDYRTAHEYDQAAYRGRQVLLGDNHQYTLASAGNIGRDLREVGEYEQSVAQLTWVGKALRDSLGPYSRTTVNALANLAISLRAAGRAWEAAVLFDDAFDRLSEETPSAPDTLACRLSRSVNMLALQIQHAELELRAVHDAYRSQLGGHHPHTIVCLNNLAMGLRADGRLGEAVGIVEEASISLAQTLGPNHPYTLATQSNLAVCLAEVGRHDEALAMLQPTADRIIDVLSPHHPDTLRCLANIAMIRHKRGDVGDREVDTAARVLRERVGDTHPAVRAMQRDRLLHRVIDPHPF